MEDYTEYYWECEWAPFDEDEEDDDYYSMYDDGTDLTAWRNGY